MSGSLETGPGNAPTPCARDGLGNKRASFTRCGAGNLSWGSLIGNSSSQLEYGDRETRIHCRWSHL